MQDRQREFLWLCVRWGGYLRKALDDVEAKIKEITDERPDLMVVNDDIVILSPDAGEKAEEEVG